MREDPLDALAAFDAACAGDDRDAAREVSVDFDLGGDAPARMFRQARGGALRLVAPAAAWVSGDRAMLGAAVLPRGARVAADLAWMLAERGADGWKVAGFVRGHARTAAWVEGWVGVDTSVDLLPVDTASAPLAALVHLALTTGDALPMRTGAGVDRAALAGVRAACEGATLRLDAVRALPRTDRRAVRVTVGGVAWGLVWRHDPEGPELLAVTHGLDAVDLLAGLAPDTSLWARGRESDADMAALGFDAALAHEAADTLRRAIDERLAERAAGLDLAPVSAPPPPEPDAFHTAFVAIPPARADAPARVPLATPAAAVSAFVRAWHADDTATLQALAPGHDAPGDSTGALVRACAAAGLRPTGEATLLTRGRRTVARIALDDGPPGASAWLLLEGATPRGGTLHESVAGVFLAGWIDAPVAWRALPESPAAEAWAAGLAELVGRMPPELREALGIRRKGRAVGLVRTLALGRAPRAAALVEVRGEGETPPERSWFLLDVDDEGVAHATGEVGPLHVAALCAGVRGVALPLLPAPAHDPLQDALARELGAEPAPPATVEEAHALARALFAALARGSFATLAEAREVH